MKRFKLFGKCYAVLDKKEVEDVYADLVWISSIASVLKENIADQLELNSENKTDDYEILRKRIGKWDVDFVEEIERLTNRTKEVFY